MIIEKKLAEFKNKIDPLLNEFFNAKIKKYRQIFPESVLLLEQVRNLTLRGGDRIRPALFYYGFCLIRKPNREEEKELLRLSTAFEMSHSYALIHDDIIDNSLLRRGGKTVNNYFASYFGDNWGERLAILAGDVAEIFGQEIFQSRLFEDRLKKALSIFLEMKEETVIGEYIDTVLPLSARIPAEKEIKNMLCYKSGNYSVQKPLLTGAVLAGVSQRQYETLSQIGKSLGLAFQIRDDILGVFGKQQSVGKSVVSDISEGKRTLLIISTWQNLQDKNKKKKLRQILGRKDISQHDISWIKETIRESGALDCCQKECQRLVLSSQSQIEQEKFKKEAKTFLAELADFIISREY